jgi:hypothetical protein
MNLRYKTYKNQLLSACLLLALFSSCNKALDISPPVATITAQKAFSTDALANSAMAGIYSLLMNNGGSESFSNGISTLYGGMSSDELLNYAGSSNLIDYQFVTNMLPTNDAITDNAIWKPAYNIIYNCNLAIEQLAATQSTDLSAATKTQLTGECKFVRAFCFFYLTNFFGDIPLPTTTAFRTNGLLARVPQAQVYQQMVQDLKDAQSVLPADYSVSGNERIRVNKWGATAMLARVYLYQKDWQDAVTQSSAVISDNSQFSLVSDLNNVFLANSSEAILQFQQNITQSPFNSTFEGLNILPNFTFDAITAGSGDFYLSDPSLYASLAPYFTPNYYFTPQLVNAFEPGDLRLTTWAQATPTPSVAPYSGITYYYPYKYTTSIPSQTTAPTQYYMVLRLAEQYLIRAEGEAETSNLAAASADLNLLRKRAGLANVTAADEPSMLKAVAHERQVELFCEWGQRFFDLKRTGQAATALGALPAKQPFNPSSLLYPIPANEIIVDPLLKQNPGYTF